MRPPCLQLSPPGAAGTRLASHARGHLRRLVRSIRDCAKINSDFTAQEFWPRARRTEGASPAHGAVTEAQRSARPKEPAEKSGVIFARSLSSYAPTERSPRTVPRSGTRARADTHVSDHR